MGKTVGIDLGTTNSVVAVMEGGQPKVIPSSEGRTTIPSVVDIESNVVGEVAKRQLVVAPQKTIYLASDAAALRDSFSESPE